MPLSDEALARLLEDRMLNHGVHVTDHTTLEGTLHVGHETDALGEDIRADEVGRLLTALLDARADGWEPTDVTVWVYDADAEDPRGSWEVREGGWTRSRRGTSRRPTSRRSCSRRFGRRFKYQDGSIDPVR